MVGPDDIVSNSVVHASAVSHCEPDGPSPTAQPKTISQIRAASKVHVNEASDKRSPVIYSPRTDPTTTRPASRAKAPDASRLRILALPTRRSAQCRRGANSHFYFWTPPALAGQPCGRDCQCQWPQRSSHGKRCQPEPRSWATFSIGEQAPGALALGTGSACAEMATRAAKPVNPSSWR
jgi:hypothetical protein